MHVCNYVLQLLTHCIGDIKIFPVTRLPIENGSAVGSDSKHLFENHSLRYNLQPIAIGGFRTSAFIFYGQEGIALTLQQSFL